MNIKFGGTNPEATTAPAERGMYASVGLDVKSTPVNEQQGAASQGKLLILDTCLQKNSLKIKFVKNQSKGASSIFESTANKSGKICMPKVIDTGDYGSLFTALSGLKVDFKKWRLIN